MRVALPYWRFVLVAVTAQHDDDGTWFWLAAVEAPSEPAVCLMER